MTEFIYQNHEIIIIPVTLTIFFYIRCGFLGMKYDDLMRKKDPNYNGYNSFKIGFKGVTAGTMIIPNYIKKNEDEIINNQVERFNRHVTGMWISVALLIFIAIFLF